MSTRNSYEAVISEILDEAGDKNNKAARLAEHIPGEQCAGTVSNVSKLSETIQG